MQNIDMTGPVTITLAVGATTGVTSLFRDTQIDLPTVLTVMSIVLPACWWLSKRFSQIDARADMLATQTDDLKTKMDDAAMERNKVLEKLGEFHDELLLLNQQIRKGR